MADLTPTGAQFEAMVARDTIWHVLGILERGDPLGHDWPSMHDSARTFERLRVLRDDLKRLRAIDAAAKAYIPPAVPPTGGTKE